MVANMSPPADGVSSMDGVERAPAASIRPVIGQPIPIFSSTSGLIDTEQPASASIRSSSSPIPLACTMLVVSRNSAHVRQARSPCLRCCPRVAVTPLSRPPHRARGGHEPLRPELAAPLGVWPSSQLTRCADGRAGWRLSGDVAVQDCCTVPASSAHVSDAVRTRRPSVFQADISSDHGRSRTPPFPASACRSPSAPDLTNLPRAPVDFRRGGRDLRPLPGGLRAGCLAACSSAPGSGWTSVSMPPRPG